MWSKRDGWLQWHGWGVWGEWGRRSLRRVWNGWLQWFSRSLWGFGGRGRMRSLWSRWFRGMRRVRCVGRCRCLRSVRRFRSLGASRLAGNSRKPNALWQCRNGCGNHPVFAAHQQLQRHGHDYHCHLGRYQWPDIACWVLGLRRDTRNPDVGEHREQQEHQRARNFSRIDEHPTVHRFPFQQRNH